MPELAVVTGGAGFIGSHLVDALLERGNQVRVFDNLDPQVHGGLREHGELPAYLNREAEFVLGDVRNRDALLKALGGSDVVFHLAARVGVGQSMYEIEPYVDVNVRGTAVLLDILANERHQVRRLAVASSMSVYGEGKYECTKCGIVFPHLRDEQQMRARDWEMRCPHCGDVVLPLPTDELKPLVPTSVYAITKRDQEEMCLTVGRAYGLPTVALRYFNTYGTRQALSNPYTGVAAIFSGRLLNNKPPVIFEDGQQQRDFVHVSDVVRATLLTMERRECDYRAINVGTGRPVTIRHVAEALAQVVGGDTEPVFTGQFRSGDIRHCFSDPTEARRMGFLPQVGFADGLGETVEWVRSQTAQDNFDTARRELEQRGLTV
jgi:dTDP-L-rhamnose 4-epimerase